MVMINEQRDIAAFLFIENNSLLFNFIDSAFAINLCVNR